MVETDFNAQDAEGNVLVLAERLEHGQLEPGSTVLLRDADGNTAEGEVVRESNGVARVAVRWDTWVSARDPIELTGGLMIMANLLGRSLDAELLNQAGARRFASVVATSATSGRTSLELVTHSH